MVFERLESVMGSMRAVAIECDQTGEMFVLKQGDPIGEYAHRNFPRRFEFAGSPVTDAWRHAATLGWRSFSKRNADGSFREIHALPEWNTSTHRTRPRWVAGDWVVAPGVDPDPPYSVAALNELDRIERDRLRAAEWHENHACEGAEQVARLHEEINRLEALRG